MPASRRCSSLVEAAAYGRYCRFDPWHEPPEKFDRSSCEPLLPVDLRHGAKPRRPEIILPFWIVNGAVICGLPSGPGLANEVNAIFTIEACSGVIRSAATSASRIAPKPSTPLGKRGDRLQLVVKGECAVGVKPRARPIAGASCLTSIVPPPSRQAATACASGPPGNAPLTGNADRELVDCLGKFRGRLRHPDLPQRQRQAKAWIGVFLGWLCRQRDPRISRFDRDGSGGFAGNALCPYPNHAAPSEPTATVPVADLTKSFNSGRPPVGRDRPRSHRG